MTGIGGIFFRAKDPKALARWYRDRLGIHIEGSMGAYEWRGGRNARQKGHTIWALFPAKTTYFGKNGASFMINYRVKDLDAVLAALRREGAKVDPKVEDVEYGRFAWVTDPEGNRIELWQPPKGYRSSEKPIPME